MDFDEWEFIPDDGFLDFREDGLKKKIHYTNWVSGPKGVFDMNYFECPLPDSTKSTRRETNPRVPSQLVPVPIHLNPTIGKAPEDDDQVMKQIPEEGGEASDQDSISQVFFKKMNLENEFVDMMKVDSPKSPTTTTRGLIIDTTTFEFDEDKGDTKSLDGGNSENENGLNIWKLGLTGIGAICSFGVAAATICLLFFGSHQRSAQHKQSHRIRFQLYNDDKRMKQVVHHATKLNEAISAVRGVPLTRSAHVTFGGYYEAL